MAKPHRNELPAPPGAMLEKDAHEVLRAWIVREGLQVSLQRAFDDPSVWGIMLVDIARHAARIYAAEGDMGAEAAMARIRFMWDAEMAKPTDPGVTRPVS